MPGRGVLIALTLFAVLALAPAASALPGDPGFEPLTPADGASLAVDPDGIPVSFTCPVYRTFSAGENFDVFGGPKDYSAGFSRSSALGADGRLRQDDLVALTNGSETGPGQCAAALIAGGSPPRPQETPGTYYWQVWRICTGCPGSYEVGPVRRLVLRASAKPAVRSPGKVYAGFGAIVPLSLTGMPDGTTVRVERRAGRGWRKVGSATALGGKGEASVTLPRGKQSLRAVAHLGSATVASKPRTVTVRRAAGWQTGRADDGSYAGKGRGLRSLSFRVTGAGRVLKSFEAKVPLLCPGIVAGQFTTQIATAVFKRARIAPDGRFVAVGSPRGGSVRIRGRVRNGAVKDGRVEMSLGNCVGNAGFSAAR